MTFDKPHMRCCLNGEFIAYTYVAMNGRPASFTQVVGKPSSSIWRAFNALRWRVFDALGAKAQRAFDKQYPIARGVA